jgi:hypothetical protein
LPGSTGRILRLRVQSSDRCVFFYIVHTVLSRGSAFRVWRYFNAFSRGRREAQEAKSSLRTSWVIHPVSIFSRDAAPLEIQGEIKIFGFRV